MAVNVYRFFDGGSSKEGYITPSTDYVMSITAIVVCLVQSYIYIVSYTCY